MIPPIMDNRKPWASSDFESLSAPAAPGDALGHRTVKGFQSLWVLINDNRAEPDKPDPARIIYLSD
jgi:hypothetical protein